MSSPKVNLTCPHCNAMLKAFRMPDGAGWDEKVQWACFNNECSYFKEGWEWMMEKYSAKSSYRYRVADPDKPTGTPLAVNNETMLLDLIIEDGE